MAQSCPGGSVQPRISRNVRLIVFDLSTSKDQYWFDAQQAVGTKKQTRWHSDSILVYSPISGADPNVT